MSGIPGQGRRGPHSKGFLRSLAVLAGGAALGQIIMVLCSPLLTRIYTPSDFGVFGVFTAAVLILNTVDSFRYEMAIPLPEEDQAAGDLLALCLGLVFVTALLTAVACYLWGDRFCQAAKVPGMTHYLWLLPLSLAGAGLVEALNYHSIRSKAYSRIAQSRVGQGAGQSMTQLGLGLASGGTFGLMVGDTVGRCLGLIPMLRGGWFSGWFRNIRWTGAKAAAKRYARFPKYMSWATLLNITALQVPFLLIPFFFGPELAGNYFLAYRILVLPSGLIGGAVAQIFLGEAASVAQEPEKLQSLATRLFLALTVAYLPLYLTIGIGGSTFFSLVFGSKWLFAGGYMQILAPMAFLWGIASPLSSVLVVRDRLRESLIFTIVELTFKLVAIFAGVHFQSLLLTVVLVSSMGGLVSLLASWRFLRAAHVDCVALGRKALPFVAMSLPLVGLVLVAVLCFKPILALLVALVLLTGTYLWTLKAARRGGLI